jgi:putative intracellular protease/amidase
MKILIVLTSHDQLGNTGEKTGFTNAEEEAVGLTAVVPFLLEDRLKERGGVYSKGADWAPNVKVDGKLMTGQNPASSGPAGRI